MNRAATLRKSAGVLGIALFAKVPALTSGSDHKLASRLARAAWFFLYCYIRLQNRDAKNPQVAMRDDGRLFEHADQTSKIGKSANALGCIYAGLLRIFGGLAVPVVSIVLTRRGASTPAMKLATCPASNCWLLTGSALPGLRATAMPGPVFAEMPFFLTGGLIASIHGIDCKFEQPPKDCRKSSKKMPPVKVYINMCDVEGDAPMRKAMTLCIYGYLFLNF